MSNYNRPSKAMKKQAAAQRRRTAQVVAAFDRDTLKRVCEMEEVEFAAAYDMTTVQVEDPRRGPHEDFYFFRDNGAGILGVAHLDTVVDHSERGCRFLDTAAGGAAVYSGALDDRLGAYILLELLPALGINHDILLTVGEESGRSTAEFFTTEKDYGWMIEFDRGGTDVVMYQYDDAETRDLVRDCGARVGDGIFSDICYLEHVGVKGFNWGVGYRDYHGTRSHAWLDDIYMMVRQYLTFHETNAEAVLPHFEAPPWWENYDRDDDFESTHYWDDKTGLWHRVIEDRDDTEEDPLDIVVENPTREQLEAVDGS